jgi:hypothetical protein
MTALTVEGYTPPRLPADVAFPEDGSEADAFKAVEASNAADLSMAAEWAAVSSDSRLTPEGQRDAITPHAQAVLTDLRKHDATLAERAKELAEELQRQTVEPDLTVSAARRAELLTLADHFGRRSEADRLRLLQEAVGGRDADLSLALVLAHPIVTGIGAPVRALLRERLVDAQVDHGAKDKLLGRAQRLAMARTALAATMDAVEMVADRTKLKAAGVATFRRRDFVDDASRAAWIGAHGLRAYKELPA